jgi:hypothetical protein
MAAFSGERSWLGCCIQVKPRFQNGDVWKHELATMRQLTPAEDRGIEPRFSFTILNLMGNPAQMN